MISAKSRANWSTPRRQCDSGDPATILIRKHLVKLTDKYENLWKIKYDEILKRLKGEAPDGPSRLTISDLRVKVAALKAKKERQTKRFEQMKFENKEANSDTLESTMLNHELASYQARKDNVTSNLAQLAFESNQESFRINLVDPAAVPKTPFNNKRLKYMAAAPVGVLFMMLGLFLLLEIKAERVADPDALSTRVQSEVYALPPLPTARSIRKLSVPDADDQIEQFIQRLDHLRFAVCGNPAELGKGRCVLITSAIGGEGKTTLAAQLAARCGNAGMSTLLIDADLRRAALCLLLDVPEGPGLSDVLKDEASVEDVVIPVQGGTFYLLPAGTPVQDTSRVLQSRKVGQLIAQLRQAYDLIIIDSPPVLPVPDALDPGSMGRRRGACLAVRHQPVPQVERARRQLDGAGIAVLGTVINGMRNSDIVYGTLYLQQTAIFHIRHRSRRSRIQDRSSRIVSSASRMESESSAATTLPQRARTCLGWSGTTHDLTVVRFPSRLGCLCNPWGRSLRGDPITALIDRKATGHSRLDVERSRNSRFNKPSVDQTTVGNYSH